MCLSRFSTARRSFLSTRVFLSRSICAFLSDTLLMCSAFSVTRFFVSFLIFSKFFVAAESFSLYFFSASTDDIFLRSGEDNFLCNSWALFGEQTSVLEDLLWLSSSSSSISILRSNRFEEEDVETDLLSLTFSTTSFFFRFETDVLFPDEFITRSSNSRSFVMISFKLCLNGDVLRSSHAILLCVGSPLANERIRSCSFLISIAPLFNMLMASSHSSTPDTNSTCFVIVVEVCLRERKKKMEVRVPYRKHRRSPDWVCWRVWTTISLSPPPHSASFVMTPSLPHFSYSKNSSPYSFSSSSFVVSSNSNVMGGLVNVVWMSSLHWRDARVRIRNLFDKIRFERYSYVKYAS